MSFSEPPNCTNAASDQGPMGVMTAGFVQAHRGLLQDWAPPPGFADVWYAG